MSDSIALADLDAGASKLGVHLGGVQERNPNARLSRVPLFANVFCNQTSHTGLGGRVECLLHIDLDDVEGSSPVACHSSDFADGEEHLNRLPALGAPLQLADRVEEVLAAVQH